MPAPALRAGVPLLRFASGALTLTGGSSWFGFASFEACAVACVMLAARMAIALAANRNARLELNTTELAELAAAIERSDVAFSVVI